MHNGFQARKRFGQHFLTDSAILEQMATAIEAHPDDSLIEIGPGKGALTQYLLNQVKHLEVIEIDRDLTAYLLDHYSDVKNLTIHNADILHFDWRLITVPRPLRIVGNLPYNITTPLLFKLFEISDQIQDMHFLLQKEVVNRLTATPGSTNYGRLSVMAQYYAQLAELFTVDAQAFSPPPKVESAYIKIMPRPPLFPANDFGIFSGVVKEAFSYRRKTLANSLRRLITVEELLRLNINPEWRPQQITVENFVKISNIINRTSQI